MIRTAPKPYPRIVPKPKRLRERKPPQMTLIAGLRCADGSVVICADRERSDYMGKRSVNKIFRVRTDQGQFLIGGSGRASIVDNTLMRLDTAITIAGANPNIVLFETHKEIVETVLYQIHQEYIWDKHDENSRALKLIVAASFNSPHSTPFLYATDEEIVYPSQLYACAGAGEDLAYYFIDKMYHDHLSREVAIMLAAFVFREVSRSVSGVGLGTDIQLLTATRGWTRFPPSDAERLGKEVPELADTIGEAWNAKVKIPDWLTQFCT